MGRSAAEARAVAPRRDFAYWERVSAAWQARSRQDTWRRHSDAVNGALVSGWMPPAARRVLKSDLFDEAVGEGLLDAIGAPSRRVVGIDTASHTVRGALRGERGLGATAADVRRLPFRDGAFDAVVSTSTLDHFRDVSDIGVGLGELARVLRPGGELILTLDNLANPVVWLRGVLPQTPLNASGVVPYHVGPTLGPRGTRRAVEQAGFDVLDMRSVLHCPRVLAVTSAGLLDRGPVALRSAFLRAMHAFESLAALPTRWVTGYYVAVRARKPVA